MVKNAWLISTLLVGLAAGGLVAGDGKEVQDSEQKIQQEKREIARTKAKHEHLSHAVDLWHDAWLKGDMDKIRESKHEILVSILDDIKKSSDRISSYGIKSRRSQFEARKQKHLASRESAERQDGEEEPAEFKRAKEMIQVKTRLLQALNNTVSFSIQYRLLGDYLGLLRRELGMARLELAEDVSKPNDSRNTHP